MSLFSKIGPHFAPIILIYDYLQGYVLIIYFSKYSYSYRVFNKKLFNVFQNYLIHYYETYFWTILSYVYSSILMVIIDIVCQRIYMFVYKLKLL